MTTKFTEDPEIVSLQKLYCPVCGQLIYAPFKKKEPQPCEHVLFLFMSNPFEFIYAAPACADIMADAMEAYERSIDCEDEDMQSPEEVDPVQYALERLRTGEGGRSILGFEVNLDPPGPADGETVGVAIDFDPDGSKNCEIEVPIA